MNIRKYSKHLELFNSFITAATLIFGAATAVFALVSKNATWLGNINWPESILIGTAISILCSFSLSLLIISWYFLKRNSLSFEKEENKIEGKILPQPTLIEDRLKFIEDRIDAETRKNQTVNDLLAAAIRVRDAEAIFEKLDAEAGEISDRLISNSQSKYETALDWKLDFYRWKGTMEQIDSLICDWQKDRSPFLDIKTHDFENHNLSIGTSPQIIDSENQIRLRTLLIAKNRYDPERIRIRKFFDAKAQELPD